MTLLNKDQLLQGDELKKETVTFEDGSQVQVREMTGHERDTWEHSMYKTVKGPKGEQDMQPDMRDYKAKLAVCTLCDEEGNLLFHFNEYSQLSKKMSAAKLEKIVEVAQRINAISKEEQENLSKSSEEDQQDNSTSGSAEN